MALGGNAILCAELTDPATVSLRMWYGHGADGWKAVDRARYDLGSGVAFVCALMASLCVCFECVLVHACMHGPVLICCRRHRCKMAVHRLVVRANASKSPTAAARYSMPPLAIGAAACCRAQIRIRTVCC